MSQKVPSKEQITVAEAGRRGGQATLENQGVEFFKRIGRKGGQKTKELYGGLFKEFGKQGGRPRRPFLDDMKQGHPQR